MSLRLDPRRIVMSLAAPLLATEQAIDEPLGPVAQRGERDRHDDDSAGHADPGRHQGGAGHGVLQTVGHGAHDRRLA